MERVRNAEVWNLVRIILLGSATLFLINIFFGFDNAVTTGVLPRSQALIHLHAGSIGWITLSQLAIAFWVFTGDREVSETHASRLRTLAYLAIGFFAGYVVSFGIAFSQGGDFFILMPIFGTGAMLVIWAAAVYSLTQLRRQVVVTTVHILVTGGLVVAAVGATMGVLLGLELALGEQILPIPASEDRVGVHAGMMDTYLILVAAGIVEWFVQKDPQKRRTIPGLLQALFLTVAGLLVPFAFLTGTLDQLLPIFALLLLLGLIFFVARIGWRALARNPVRGGVKSWGFFGTFWLVIYVGIFIYFAVSLGNPDAVLPPWLGAVFVHAGFVGMMTNIILGVDAARTEDAAHVLSWGESSARWLINLGMLVFFALKITSDTRLGAIVMGIGVLLGVVTMIQRLRASGKAGAEVAGTREAMA
ncbi:MAG: hypothetical protein ACE5JF_02735 [Anaerolineales bacterium]